MANYCLVKKYKATVNNPDLVELGVLRIKVGKARVPSADSQKLNVVSATDVWIDTHVKSGGNVLFGSTYGATDRGNDTIVDASTHIVYFSDEVGYIDLYNKEKIYTLRVDGWNGISYKLSDLKYMPILTNFGSAQGAHGISGDIHDIANLTGLQAIMVPYSTVTGNVNEIGSMFPALTSLNIASAQGFTGTLEGFVEAACTVGSPRTIDFAAAYSKITFNGAPIATTYKIVITAEGATVQNTYLTETYATYTKATGTWVYA